ncbi:hypothetical protein S40288_09208 [Stachybotrys chartarum IBT 40288]|nr:hypothetical protein S40288_09208 [Stachybotrys chartarum IBT 40288]
MDLAYNPHAERARRKNRSSTNLDHLSLAPLTVKIPFKDDDAVLDADNTPSHINTSYLQGKSAPTTPRLLSRSPGPRTRHHRRAPSAPGTAISKSKSSSHLLGVNVRNSVSGAATPRRRKDDVADQADRRDSDWIYRAGVAMSYEAREYKGQAWLVSRQSSTSLAGMHDAEEEAFEAQLARERELASRRGSRRGSSALADDESTPRESRLASRSNSRSQSQVGLQGYFSYTEHDSEDQDFAGATSISGADFVNIDEKLEELERDTLQDDEAAVKRLVKRGQAGPGSWFDSLTGWSLFAVEEGSDDSEDGDDDVPDNAVPPTGRSGWSSRHFEGVSNAPEEPIPPPRRDEGGWQDAAWLLSVASKVMF